MDITVLYNLTYGMYLVGALNNDRPIGCIINTCMQLTSDQPLFAICLNKKNYTLTAMHKGKRFSLSIISENTQSEIIGTFGFRSSKDIDKYSRYGYSVIDGCPMINGDFAGRLILEVQQCVECATHVLIIARLIDTIKETGTPMTYAYYHNVIKGKAPQNAPTYQNEEIITTDTPILNRYKCGICQYVVEMTGNLPPDYICPVCGADSSHFHKL